MGICVISMFWLLWIMPLWTWVYKYLFEFLLWILLGICLDSIAGPCVIVLSFFMELLYCFPQQLHHFTVPPTLHKGSTFHILASTCYHVSFNLKTMAIRIGVKRYLCGWSIFQSMNSAFLLVFCVFLLFSCLYIISETKFILPLPDGERDLWKQP